MIKEVFLKKYFETQNKKREALKLAELEKKRRARITKKKQELEDRLEGLKVELQDAVIDRNGLVSVDDYKDSLERLGRLDASISELTKLQDTSVESISGLIDEINARLVDFDKKIKETKESVPSLNDFRIETNKRINDAIEQLGKRIGSIKVSDLSPEIKEIKGELKRKADRTEIPKEIEIRGEVVGQVVRIDYPKKTVYKINRDRQSLAIIRGSGGATTGSTVYAGVGINISGSTITNTMPGVSLQAGNNIAINGVTISSTGSAGSTIYAGNGINITGLTVSNTLGFVGTGGVSVLLTGGTYTLYGASTKVNTNETTEGGSGLYYSASRFSTDFSTKTTNDLSEGVSNFYYKTSRFVGLGGASVSVNGLTTTIFSQGQSNFLSRTGDTVAGSLHVMDGVLSLGNTSSSETQPLRFAPDSQTPINIYQRSTVLTIGTGSGTNNRIIGFNYVSSSGSITPYGAAAEIYPIDSTGTPNLGRVGNRWNMFASSLGVGNTFLINALGTSGILRSGLSGQVYNATTLNTQEVTEGASNFYYMPARFVGTGGVSVSNTGATLTIYGSSMGTMGIQNSNGVSITGGAITNVSALSAAGFFTFLRTNETIATGVITATSSFIAVDTEGAAASDDLVTINGQAAGRVLILQSTSSARDITVKTTGNIKLPADRVLNNGADKLFLIADNTNWYELAFADNGA